MIETCSKTFINRTELKGTHIILYVIFSFKYFLIFRIKFVNSVNVISIVIDDTTIGLKSSQKLGRRAASHVLSQLSHRRAQNTSIRLSVFSG